MKRLQKLFCLVLCLVLISTSFVGCEKGKAQIKKKNYQARDAFEYIDSGIVAENSNYCLLWDVEKYAVLLKEKKSGDVWSTIPYDYYNNGSGEGFAAVNLHSPIIIEYIDKQHSQIKESMGYVEAVSNETVSSVPIKDGIRVTYYCDDIEISVPVEYRLTEDGIDVRIIIKDIVEGNNPIYSISASPYLCSAKGNTDSYMFIPSGSGALMAVDQGERASRKFLGRVFGDDLATTKYEKLSNTNQVNLPIFGVKTNNKSLMAIIDKGADIAEICANAGDSEIGYANVYAKFLLRGSDDNLVTDVSGYKTPIAKYTDEMVNQSYVTVKYIPLGKNTGYSEMASYYRDYLINRYSITPKTDNSSLYLKILGVGMTKKEFLGIEYNSVVPISSYLETKKIIEETSKIDTKLVVELDGYGESGLEKGKVSGGGKFSDCLGSKKELNRLQNYLKENKIPLYWNYDIMSFAKSGNGLNTLNDAAKTATGVRAVLTEFNPTNFNMNENRTRSYLVRRDKVVGIAQNTFKDASKNNVDALSLTTLCNYTYSDYSNTSGYAKCGASNVVAAVLKMAKKQKFMISADSPNAYAAVYCSHIIGSHNLSNEDVAFDRDIPFYQMVFKGIIPISVSPINYSFEPREAFLGAIETGSALCFSVGYDDDHRYCGTADDLVKFSSYSQWKDVIADYVNESNEFLKSVNEATVVNHSEILPGVTKTVFSNGISVIVNKTQKPINCELGKVEALSFVYSKEGTR